MSLIQTEQEILVNTRAGGVYIPPARLRQMQQKITDKSSPEYQRITWEALKKSINGLINKVSFFLKKNLRPFIVTTLDSLFKLFFPYCLGQYFKYQEHRFWNN